MTEVTILLGQEIFPAFKSGVSDISEYSEWGKKIFPFLSKSATHAPSIKEDSPLRKNFCNKIA